MAVSVKRTTERGSDFGTWRDGKTTTRPTLCAAILSTLLGGDLAECQQRDYIESGICISCAANSTPQQAERGWARRDDGASEGRAGDPLGLTVAVTSGE